MIPTWSPETTAANTNLSDDRDHLPSEEYTHKAMRPVLGRFDMIATYVCALFLLTNAVIGATGGPVSLIYLVLGGILFFVPCVIITAQLGVMFPYEGSLYNWTYKALGSYWSFFVGICYWLTGVLAAITGSDAFVTVLQGLNNSWLPQPWQQGLVILGILFFAAVIGTRRFRTTQNVINGIVCLTFVAVVLVGLAAVVWLVTGHASATNFSQPDGWSINPGNFSLFGIITLSFIGTSGPLNMAGEISESGAGGRRRIITRHLLWGTVIVFACYFVSTLAILVVRGQAILNDPVLPFEAFTTVAVPLGRIAGNIAVICFLGYCIAAAIFYTYASARVLMVAGIDHRIPEHFGKLNKNRVPAYAVIFQTICAAVVVVAIFIVVPYVAPFGGNAANALVSIYTVNSAATTLVWTIATMFFFLNVIFLYRRHPLSFRQQRLFAMPIIWGSVVVGGVACVVTIVGVLAYSWIPQLIANSQWWYIVGGLTVVSLAAAAIVSMIANSQADWENMEKV